uniref:Uncharacterized protein n=1 Tax=Siphoviridae sp. ctNYt19 TaxID=2825472 RepID=A0A8S5QIX7_9CAUD|nr:MAG TPA: hypothetical protein [Siphoviridae sp. ctNYt19]DAN19007.1 MAG TPA: hypothetical protein [Caudoviricetes sp.]DAS76850.1 MAG TPA: hypothetical protein [Caudoviricetes sp.]
MKIYLIPTFYKKRADLPTHLFFFYTSIVSHLKRTRANANEHFYLFD